MTLFDHNVPPPPPTTDDAPRRVACQPDWPPLGAGMQAREQYLLIRIIRQMFIPVLAGWNHEMETI